MSIEECEDSIGCRLCKSGSRPDVSCGRLEAGRMVGRVAPSCSRSDDFPAVFAKVGEPVH